MKNQLKTTVLLASAVLVSSLALGQAPAANVLPPNGQAAGPAGLVAPGQVPPPPPGGPGQVPPPPPGGPGLLNNPRGPLGGLQALSTVSGRVVNYVANERYIYNALTLQENGQTVLVRFPDHLGSQLMGAAKKGETVSVTGFSETGPDGVAAFHMVSIKAGGTILTDTPPNPPVDPVVQPQINFSGTITDFRRNLDGMISGVILTNKEIIELPPPVLDQLQGYLKSGSVIQGTGFKDVLPLGAVAAPGMPALIHPQTISVNGQTYLVR